MKFMNSIIILLLSIAVFFSGCSHNSMKQQELVERDIQKPQMESLEGPLSQQDEDFVQAVMKSVSAAEQIMSELEAILQEMEVNDDLHDASEMMNVAKQETLFQWNMMHNEYHPVHPDLIQLKEYYENILTRYRQGMSLEMEGMASGDAPKMKQGYEMTGQAMKDLQELAKQLPRIFQ